MVSITWKAILFFERQCTYCGSHMGLSVPIGYQQLPLKWKILFVSKNCLSLKEKLCSLPITPISWGLYCWDFYTVYMQNFKMTRVSYITPWGVLTLFGLHFLTLLTSDSFCGTRNQCPSIFRYLKSVQQMSSLVITWNVSFFLISEKSPLSFQLKIKENSYKHLLRLLVWKSSKKNSECHLVHQNNLPGLQNFQ